MDHTNTLAVIKATPAAACALQVARTDVAFQRFLGYIMGVQS